MCDRRCKENRTGERASGLYVHVPFCRRKCRYCDFYSVPCERAAAERYVEAAAAELARCRDRLRLPLRSVYVGGGTPTALPAEPLRRLLSGLAGLVNEATEFTVEANPQTLTDASARRLAASGVNRVSLGAQSFDPVELRLLGRRHGPDDIPRSVEAARHAGIERINLDLIYGIPGQSLASWEGTLGKTVRLAPTHLSCYALSFPSGTPLEADLHAGRVAPVPDDTQWQCYEAARRIAERAGLRQYELSNFSLGGCRCTHNISYWNNEAYIGIGPAAASYLDGIRRTRLPDVDAWATAVLDGRSAPATAERLRGRRRLAEALMLGLRMTEGIDRENVTQRYGMDPLAAFPDAIRRHVRSGHLLAGHRRLRLAPRAYFVADSVLADLLAEA